MTDPRDVATQLAALGLADFATDGGFCAWAACGIDIIGPVSWRMDGTNLRGEVWPMLVTVEGPRREVRRYVLHSATFNRVAGG